jgi:hypothetical protein
MAQGHPKVIAFCFTVRTKPRRLLAPARIAAGLANGMLSLMTPPGRAALRLSSISRPAGSCSPARASPSSAGLRHRKRHGRGAERSPSSRRRSPARLRRPACNFRKAGVSGSRGCCWWRAVRPFRHHAARHRRDHLPEVDVYITDWRNARDVRSPPAPSASTTMSPTSQLPGGDRPRGPILIGVCQTCAPCVWPPWR